MSTVFCPGGSSSQSGSAVRVRYPDAAIQDCGKIPSVPLQLDSNEGPYVVPIWNSHQGEVKAAEYVWNNLQEDRVKITDLWAKMIEFVYLRRVGVPTAHRKIGSVVVAQTQCSVFLEQGSVEFIGCDLTTVAFEKYKAGAEWDGVLVGPELAMSVEAEFEIVSRDAANPNNFTSFVRLVPSRAFPAAPDGSAVWITGVTMPSFQAKSLGDAEQSFFDQLLEPVANLANIPRLVFVLKRTAKVGLIFEGTHLSAGDLLDAEQLEAGDIVVHEEAGVIAELYSNQLRSLFERYCPALRQNDFILHQGKSTCLFACPPVGLYTHGYEVESVEPVVRYYINKLFQLWDDGVECTELQGEFFERYKDAWQQAKGSAFIDFERIGPGDGLSVLDAVVASVSGTLPISHRVLSSEPQRVAVRVARSAHTQKAHCPEGLSASPEKRSILGGGGAIAGRHHALALRA